MAGKAGQVGCARGCQHGLLVQGDEGVEVLQCLRPCQQGLGIGFGTQRAGVQVTGTAQAPRVKLYSEPTLSDAETLSWVVLGRSSASSGGESLLLQQAALALLGGFGKGGTGGSLASRFGLDEVGFKGPGSGGDVRESAVTLGKRLANDFYVTYERSLSGTLGTLFIFYDLTNRLTLRGQAGQQSGIDLIYTVKYN